MPAKITGYTVRCLIHSGLINAQFVNYNDWALSLHVCQPSVYLASLQVMNSPGPSLPYLHTGTNTGCGLGIRLSVAWEWGWVRSRNKAGCGLGMRLGLAWEWGWVWPGNEASLRSIVVTLFPALLFVQLMIAHSMQNSSFIPVLSACKSTDTLMLHTNNQWSSDKTDQGI